MESKENKVRETQDRLIWKDTSYGIGFGNDRENGGVKKGKCFRY